MSAIPLLDCHQHLIYPDRFPYSWAGGIPQLAGKAFTCEDYADLVRSRGSVRTLFMETAPDAPHGKEESRLVMELADQPDTLIDGLILACHPESDEDFDAYVDSVRHPKLVGFRRILHIEPDELSQQAGFVANVGKLAAHDLTFDLCLLPRQLFLGMDLADKSPDVQFILDHCGIPDVAGGSLDPWRDHITELARRPNVACKVSGVLAYCSPDNATTDAIRPYVEHCIEAFGWDRVVWGSDWPVVCMTAGLPAWIAVTEDLFAAESETNRHKLYHQNAERLYLKQ